MAVDERARRQMHERLEQAIGIEATDTLMGEIASLRGEQLATRHDVELLGGDMRTGFAELRGETRGAIAELRAEMHEQLGAVHGLIAAQTRSSASGCSGR
ncbi:MAG: hypothetical protein KY469_15335 [Actinobacteria bacterium]|nr:hypothetical protein [Actinomycetota bacterium]